LALALIAEPSLPISAALRKFLESAKHEVVVAYSVAEAIEAISAQTLPDVVFASVSGNFDGEAVCSRVKALKPLCPVVLVYAPEEDEPELRADAVRADGFLLGPLKRPAVKGREEPLKKALQTLEAELGKLRQGGAGEGGEIRFLKRFLPLEVKRSRRYQYPIAVVLIGLDQLAERLAASATPEAQRAAIRTEASLAIHKVIRDIDLTVPFADDKYLVLLPHTPRDGAMIVASRLQAQLSKLASFEGGTASAGVASYEPKSWTKDHVSFGGLMREATEALLKAQANGGGQIEGAAMAPKTKRDRISIG
jgi:PleD family two-component response regulator